MKNGYIYKIENLSTSSSAKENKWNYFKNIDSLLSLYSEIIQNLKTNLSFTSSSHDDDRLNTEINHNFLINMFEAYKDSNERVIESLVSENIYLRNELKSQTYNQKLVLKRLQEIDDLGRRTYQKDKYNFKLKRPMRLQSDTSISSSKISFPKPSISKSEVNFNSIIEKLNTLKENLLELNTKCNLQDAFIKHLKNKKTKDNHLENRDFNNPNLDKSEALISAYNINNPSFIESSKKTNDYENLKYSIPRWIPDFFVKNCGSCGNFFNLFTRKHHCRKCGDIFCSTCCNKYDFFLPFYNKKVRMCHSCFNKNQL